MGEFNRIWTCRTFARDGKGLKNNIKLYAKQVFLLKFVLGFARSGMIPGGAHKNHIFFGKFIQVDENVDRAILDLIFDPQTSGELLISLEKQQSKSFIEKMAARDQKAWIIGEITYD